MNSGKPHLSKRLQDILARENTIGSLMEALYQVDQENKKARRLSEQLFDERLKRKVSK